MISVRVPATTANLGPGFDSMGLALSVYGKLSFTETETGFTFENVSPAYCNADNLAVRAYLRTLREIGLPETGLHVKIESDIPVSRGLGSSASLIVGGIVAANAAHGSPLCADELLKLATELEGHPDNVAPALLGGLTVSMTEDGKVYSMRCPVAENLRFCVLVPDFELETSRSRAVLPKEVPFRDGCYNAAHALILLKALETGSADVIGAAMRDRLHQPYRRALVDEYDAVEAAASAAGARAVCLSGAGPSILCVYTDPSFAEKMRAAVLSFRNHWEVLLPEPDRTGAAVL